MKEYGSERDIVAYLRGGSVYLVLSGLWGRTVTVHPELFTGPRFNISLGYWEFYMGMKELYVVSHIYLAELAYLSGESLNETCLDKFDGSPNSQRVYSNGAYTVYGLTLNITREEPLN